MSTPEWTCCADRIWRLYTASGEVLATLEHDKDTGQYRSNGVPVGANFKDATAKAEANAKKAK